MKKMMLMTVPEKGFWTKIERLLSEAEENIDNVFGNYTTEEIDEVFQRLHKAKRLLRKTVEINKEEYRFPYIYALALRLKAELVNYIIRMRLKEQGFLDPCEYADIDLEEKLAQEMLVVYDNMIHNYLDRILQLYLEEKGEEEEVVEEAGEEEDRELWNDDLDWLDEEEW